MTKKDYELIAKVLRGQLNHYSPDYGPGWDTARHAVRGVAFKLAWDLARDNPRFNQERFIKAALGE
jgi:hypothetical protein